MNISQELWIAALLFFLAPIVASAADVRLSWQPEPLGTSFLVFQAYDLSQPFAFLAETPSCAFDFTSDAPASFFYVVAKKQTLHLIWQPSSDADQTAGYAIYYGPADAPLAGRLDVGNALSAVVEGLQPGVTYHFAAVAYDLDGNEGDFSSELVAGLESSVTGLKIEDKSILK